MGQMMNMLQQHIQQQQQQQQQQASAAAAAPNQPEPLDLDEDTPDDEDPPDWASVFEPFVQDHMPQRLAAQQFVQRLASPPPLDVLRQSESQVVRYRGIPQTPAARKHRLDQSLQQVQKKAELTLHILTHAVETQSADSLSQASAFVRSLWQDTQEIRRHLLARGQSNKLEPRPDQTAPRLLSREEEQKLARGRQMKHHSAGDPNSSSSSFQNFSRHREHRFRSSSRGRGKGGKGKGKPSQKQN